MTDYLITTKNPQFRLIKPRVIKADSLYEAERAYKHLIQCSWCICCGVYVGYWRRSVVLSKSTFNQLLDEASEDLKNYLESTQADLQPDELSD